jgi:TonB-dependent SusC/RagA subfamily outer membrane receptor
MQINSGLWEKICLPEINKNLKIAGMKIKVFLLIAVSVICMHTLSAQKNNTKITVSGTVTDASGNPISNAIVMIDGKNTSSVTDAKGMYKIKVKSDAQTIGILTFTSGIREEAISGRTEINIRFGVDNKNVQQPAEGVNQGDAGVNTGYSYTKEKNVTTQIDRIDGTNKKYASYSSIGEMIQREVAGVKVTGTTVVIQNSKDFFGSVPALIVVDGVYMDNLPAISPVNVESVEVLKGTAASMYGSRGYGGVILIKTKIKN